MGINGVAVTLENLSRVRVERGDIFLGVFSQNQTVMFIPILFRSELSLLTGYPESHSSKNGRFICPKMI